MSLYDTIRNHYHLPNARKDWEQYRNTLTNYIIKEANQVDIPLDSLMSLDTAKPTLGILGAGPCNDIDLSKLCQHFSSIALLDWDSDALQQAVETYHLENLLEDGTLVCICDSFTGITDTDYHGFCEALQFYLREQSQPVTAEGFTNFAIKELKNILKACRAPILPNNRYDYVWCMGLHSQLFTMFSYIFHTFCLNMGDTGIDCNISEDTFSQALKEKNNEFLPLFNQEIINMAKQAVYFGNEWNQSSPIEGAYQCITDIQSRGLPLTEAILRWPMDVENNRFFDMLIQKITISQ